MDSFSASSQSAFPTIPQVVEKYSTSADNKYSITAQFFGYRAKEDVTALPPGFLVSPSQNVLTNAAGLIFSRPGYSLYGPAAQNTNLFDPIRSSYDWETHLGFEQHIREHGGVLEWCYVNGSTVSWLPLMDSNLVSVWTQGDNFFRYAEYWNTTELTDELVMVNGDGNVYRWNGAKANFASATSAALSASPFISGTPPGEVITFVCPAGTTFSGSTTTAGNLVTSTTVGGQVVGMIVIVNQPAANDTITLVINGTTITLTWVSSPYQAPWKFGYGQGSIAIGYNYTNIGSTAVAIYAPNVSSPSITQTRNNLAAFFSDPSLFNSYAYVGFNDTPTASLISSLTYNQNPFIQGSTTTSGNVISSTTGLTNLTFAMINNPANGDTVTFTINGYSITFTFVSVIGTTPGNVLIGGSASTTLTHLLGLLQNPGTTSANQVALSAVNQDIIPVFTYVVSTGITIQGQQSWAELGFYTQTSGRSVVINDTSFTYTGGETTQTIIGVSPNPTTAVTINYGDPIVQLPVATPCSSISGMQTDFNPNLVSAANNQIWYGNETQRIIFFSKVNNYADVTSSSPRLPGEGSGTDGITLDATCTGFAPQDTLMNVFAGPDWIYNIYFGPGSTTQPSTQTTDTVSGVTIVYESISTTPLKISPGQGAQSQEAIFKVKNSVMFITNEPAIDDLGKVASSINLPEAITMTDSIKNDFLNYDLTGAFGLYFKYFLYVLIPAESKLIVYNFTRGWWEAPQTFDFSRLAIINGALYAHSNVVPETYRVYIDNPLDPNVVYNDNGNPINAIAYFSYQNFGLRAPRKHFTEFFVEGYITSNTTLTAGNKYDFGGFSGEQTYSIAGNNSKYLVYTFADNSLGKVPIGKNPIGSVTDSVQNMPKFRQIFTSININFFEDQAFFQSNDINQSWSLLCFGYDLTQSEDQLGDIKT